MLQEADIVQDWINEGIQKGIEKGIEKGQIKALQEAIMDILEDRFGAVKKGIGKRLAALDDPAVLRSLLKKSVRAESPEEFARFLEEI